MNRFQTLIFSSELREHGRSLMGSKNSSHKIWTLGQLFFCHNQINKRDSMLNSFSVPFTNPSTPCFWDTLYKLRPRWFFTPFEKALCLHSWIIFQPGFAFKFQSLQVLTLSLFTTALKACMALNLSFQSVSLYHFMKTKNCD